MKIALSCRGSRGDVYPVLRIAEGLAAQGHDLTLCVPPLFAERAAASVPRTLTYSEDIQQVMQDFGAGARAARETLRWLSRHIDEQFQLLLEASADADVLVTTAAELTAGSVAQHRRIPHFRVAYAPVLPGDQPPPVQPFQRLPIAVNRALWRGLNGAVGLLFGRKLDRWRHTLQLPPTGDIGHHLAASSHTLLAISALLAPPPRRDWPFPYSYTGCCLGGEGPELPDSLQRFLAGGSPPIYLGLGSVKVGDPGRLSEVALEAARLAGCRLILGKGWAGLDIPATEQVLVVGETDHLRLFPRLSGVVHHGGSGTTHSAAWSGVPQLVMPQLADQFYWAHRVYRLGLGPSPISPRRLTARRLADIFVRMIGPGTYTLRARALGQLLREEDGVGRALELISGQPSWLQPPLRSPLATAQSGR